MIELSLPKYDVAYTQHKVIEQFSIEIEQTIVTTMVTNIYWYSVEGLLRERLQTVAVKTG